MSATRMKVDRGSLLDTIDKAVAKIDSAIARITKEADKWDWKKDAREIVRSLRAEIQSGTEDSFRDAWSSRAFKKPDHKRRISNLENEKAELLDFRQLVEMSAEEAISVSTSDYTIQRILHVVRNRSVGRSQQH